jgi:hypothetical protein
MNLTNLRIVAVCAALSAPALASAPVFAQQPPPAPQAPPADPAAVLTRSRQLFTQANKLYDEGNLPQARAAYFEAWKLKKAYDVGGNLGNVEADLKMWRDAAEHLAYAIREFPAGGRPTLRDNMLSRLTESQKYVGRLRFQVNHPGAEIFVDGASVGVAPVQEEIYVDPGTHSVEARLEGYPTVQVTVTTARGRTDTIPLDLVVLVTGPNKKIVIAVAVVAGVVAIAGGAMLGLASSKESSASNLYTQIKATPPGGCPPASSPGLTGNCATLKSDLDTKATFGVTGVSLLAGAGAIGVATLIYGLTGGSRGGRAGLLLTPVVTADTKGVFFKGSF